MRATIRDVAAKAGVSHTTVSWAIHDDPRISPETKERVRRAIAELDYHPNYQARSLVSGRVGAIAVVASTFSTMFETELMRGIEESLVARASELSVNQYSTLGSRERKDKVLREILRGRRADAVIGLSLKPEEALLADFREAGIPVILVEESAAGASSVLGDSAAGAHAAADCLWGLGRRRIGLVVGRVEGEEVGLSPPQRLRAFLDGLGARGLEPASVPVAYIDDYRLEEGREALGQLLGLEPALDAVFCAAGDIVALGILDEARRRSIEVPDRLAVIGYDDLFVSSLVSPPLSTLRQPIRLMGATALEMAFEAIAHPKAEPASRTFEPELVLRGST